MVRHATPRHAKGGRPGLLAIASPATLLSVVGRYRLVSPMFLHGSLMHLASNSFSLFRIGPLVEGAYGGRRCPHLHRLLSSVHPLAPTRAAST